MQRFICFAALIGAVTMVAPSPASAQIFGGVDDVPTWNIGDSWDMQRRFTIALGGSIETDLLPLQLNVNIEIVDNYTLEVSATTPTQVVNNNLRGFTPTLAYLRERTAGLLDVNLVNGQIGTARDEDGTIRTPLILLNGNISDADSSQGYSWNAVGDLGQIRENFTMPLSQGNLTLTGNPPTSNLLCDLIPGLTNEDDPANGVHCGDTVPFKLSLTLSIDHTATGATPAESSGLELMDFPTKDVGEKWTEQGFRGISGGLTIQALPDASNPGDFVLDETFDIPEDTAIAIAYAFGLTEKNVADPNVPGISDARHITGTTTAPGPNNVDQIYYSPAAKELSSWKLGDLSIPFDETLTVTVTGFTTQLSPTSSPAFVLNPDSDIINLSITPPLPIPGELYRIDGQVGLTTLPGTTITAIPQLPGGPGMSFSSTVAVGGGFQIFAFAPTVPDLTPWVVQAPPITNGDREFGSYGVVLTRGGLVPPPNQKVLTLRVQPINATGNWDKYE